MNNISPFINRTRDRTEITSGILEVIVDSCSLGKDVLAGLEPFLHYVTEKKRRFSDYHVTIPIQIGTESQRRIFPDFLHAELMLDRAMRSTPDLDVSSASGGHHPSENKPKAPGALEKFYRTHQRNIRIIETEISLAFKLHYGAQAAQLLKNDEALKKQIISETNALIERYAPLLGQQTEVTLETLNHFIASIEIEEEDRQQNLPKLSELIDSQNRKLGIRDESQITAHVSAEILKDHTARAKSFFRHVTPSERYLLQAMYTNDFLNKTIQSDAKFKKFRFNLGEEEIANYLDASSEVNRNNTVLVVSEDYRARNHIERVAKQSGSNVYSLGNYGFGQVLKDLKLIRSKDPLVMNQWSIASRRAKAEERPRPVKSADYPLYELRIAQNFMEHLGVSASRRR